MVINDLQRKDDADTIISLSFASDSQWPRGGVLGGTADAVRDVLQVDAEADRGGEEEDGDGSDRRGGGEGRRKQGGECSFRRRQP